MAKLRLHRVGTTVAWAASGAISLELSPVPFTITGLLVVCHTDVTTTTATNLNDYWDRFIGRLNLTGMVGNVSKTFFDFSNLRLPYHMSRFNLGRFAPRRPTVVADSQTNNLQQFPIYIHFGTRPFKNGGYLNRMDLTAGIPPTGKGQLTLGGTFGAAAAMGTNVTINATASCFIEVYLVGVAADEGDPPQLYVPQAYPVWSMATPTPAATSTTFATPYNVTSGEFLQALFLMTTNGTGAPRDDQVLNSLRLFHQLENRDIITFGGRAGASDAAGGDYKVAEYLTQQGLIIPSDNNATLGVPSITDDGDEGLVMLRMEDYTTKVHPLYGADLRRIATGDLRLDHGVADATGITMDVLYQRYELNPNHPANAAWL